MDLGALCLEPLGGARNHRGGGRVDRLDLVEDDLLVREGERHGHCHLQRADGHVDRTINAADQLAVVPDDDLDSQYTLLIDGELLLEIEGPLTQREENVFLYELATRIVSSDLGGEFVDHRRIECLSQGDLIGEQMGEFTHRLLIVTERHVVALELIAPLLQRDNNRIDLRLRTLISHEIALQGGADSGDLADRASEPTCLGIETRWIELLDFYTQIRE